MTGSMEVLINSSLSLMWHNVGVQNWISLLFFISHIIKHLEIDLECCYILNGLSNFLPTPWRLYNRELPWGSWRLLKKIYTIEKSYFKHFSDTLSVHQQQINILTVPLVSIVFINNKIYNFAQRHLSKI